MLRGLNSLLCIHYIHSVSGPDLIVLYGNYVFFLFEMCKYLLKDLYFLGTFCTLDICISRLEDVGTVDVRGTVERIRSQRAYSIQMPDQYVFCHLALIEYALGKQLIPHVDLAGFDNLADDESE